MFSFLLDPFIFAGRYMGIVWNENMLGAFTITAFSILLLKNNRRTNLDYIILDDKADYLISQTNNFFQTDKTVGLTPQVVQRIINNFHCASS